MAWRASYQAYGTAHISDSTLGSQKFNVRFPGQYFDAESGMHYNRFRYYAPELGRYISADPIGQLFGGDANLYRYVWANPASFIDPLGLAGAFGGRRRGESLLECMDRLAKEFYGDTLAASDALAVTSAATAAATAASSAAASAAEFVAKDAAASAKVGGATTAGSIVEKRAAANAAARTGGRIAAGRAVLGAASKASGVATVAATAFSAGARAAFYPDCKDPHPCDEESANEE